MVIVKWHNCQCTLWSAFFTCHAQVEMEAKDTQLQQMNAQLQQMNGQLQQKDGQIQQQGAELQEKALQLNRQQTELQTLRVRKNGHSTIWRNNFAQVYYCCV